MSKPEKGLRKVHVHKQTSLFLLAGLVLGLAAAGIYKVDGETCFKLYLAFAGGVTGAVTAFNWGNSKEHAAAPPTEAAK